MMMMRYDRVNLYTRASNLFLFLESLFLFLAHRTIRSLIIYLGEREDDESVRMWARRDLRTGERISLELILVRMQLEMGE